MLIPIVNESEEYKDAEYIKCAYAATGCVMVVAPKEIPSFKGRKLMVGGVNDVERMEKILNSGTSYGVVEEKHSEAFTEAFPNERLVVQANSFEALDALATTGKVSRIMLKLNENITNEAEFLDKVKSLLVANKTLVLGILVGFSINGDASMVFSLEGLIGKLHKLVKDRPVDVAVEVSDKSIAENPPADLISPARCLLSCAAPSDRPDGLFATVVSDERGMALGLVYSNQASILASVGTGRGVYWSRSRSKLWRKGEESGAHQELLSISLDCDQDAFRFCVIQRGVPPSFCHTNTRTCWGADSGIGHLFRTLQERKVSAPEGSYTARLYRDSALLRDKLLEESSELYEAVKGATDGTDSTAHVEEETADVLYFALTACVAGGGSLLGVERQLDKRSLAIKRRKGDSKQHRKDEADERLKQIAEAKRLKEGK